MKRAEKAIIKKDIRGITSNRRLFSALWIVPLALTVILPSIFVCAAHFAPDDPLLIAAPPGHFSKPISATFHK